MKFVDEAIVRVRAGNGGRGATRRQHWARNALVVGQTALALVLLIGAGDVAEVVLRWRLEQAPAGAKLTLRPLLALRDVR